MSKKTLGNGADYSNVSEALIKRVEEVIAESKKHNYSISKVYGAYNEAYGLKEIPTGCSSCLQTRVRMLIKWLDCYNKQAEGSNNEKFQAVHLKDIETDKTGRYVFFGELLVVIDDEANETLKPLSECAIASAGIYESEAGTRYDVDGEGKYTKVETDENTSTKYPNLVSIGFVSPIEGVQRYLVKDNQPIDFTPDPEKDGKGKVIFADGSKVAPGTYILDGDGKTAIAVQTGGRATIKTIK